MSKELNMDPYKFEVCDLRGRIAPITTGPFSAGGLDTRGAVPDGCSWEEMWSRFRVVDPDCENAIKAGKEVMQ